ncbi:hypothetical protein BGW38_008811 [Lunasporangiospora selenospora]|uniref:DUF221-domain-containing protein n=1 Tax=Lunasporangiospora selenospora TaxID=979761 RepID=A0A9P6G3H7_9FUNG|nr:hypothetical protein BGW38_008811 [Lunasporangiospora selenospora]
MSSPSDGEKQLAADASVGAFTSALIFNGLVGAGIFIAFGIVRHWNKKIYQPRTYLVPENVQSPELPRGPFSWITASFTVSDTILLDRVGLDAYMYLRFLRMSAILFLGFTLVGLPILLPVNLVNGEGGGGLTDFTIGNVLQSWRLWFHLLLTIFFCGATVYMLWREMLEYTRRRHAYLLSEAHSKTPQSTTILVSAIPQGLDNEEALCDIFDRFPGGVKKVWVNRHPKKLEEICKERDEITLKLENAEYNYIRSAYGKKSKGNEAGQPERPIGRTSAIPFMGPKVDLIEFYSERLSKLNKEIDEMRGSKTSSTLKSAFIQFHTQFAAHSAVQTVVHPTPFKMSPIFAEISPLDVVWDNMGLDTVIKKGRKLISLSAATALVIFWTIPVVFVSSIANISSLVKIFSFLSFLQDLPPSIVGIIQGILPPLFLAILMALLPIILTLMSTFEGHVRHSTITLAVMKKYFFFLVVNVLLVSTISGGIFNTISGVDKDFSPIELISILSVRLPGCSTFFITYALLQGLTGPFMELLQIAPLVLNFVFTQLLAKSPRQLWNIQGRLSSVNYGILFPKQTLMFSIGILYSTIAPLVLPCVAFYFTMFYFVYRHQFLYVYNTPVETGGLAFPIAVKQVFTGIFIFEVTMFGIFLAKLATLPVIPHLVLLGLLIAVTVLALVNMNEAFNPLVTYLPVALFSKDLHVDIHGNVTHGNDEKAGSNPHDEESFEGERGSVMALDRLPHRRNQSQEKAVGKQELDEVATVSSQLPAFPTPNPSEVDSASLSAKSPPFARGRPDADISPGQLRQQGQINDKEGVIDAELKRLQDQAYCHPAMYTNQKPIWLPQDLQGLVNEEIAKLSNLGILVATNGAKFDAVTAKTQVSGILYAPGEESQYRLERGV